MHDTAYEHGRLFFELYGSETVRTVVELGSQDVNGSLRDHCPAHAHYIGLDVMPAKGVDLVINPTAPLPIASETVDAVVTNSAFEHDMCFWETFLELARIVRPGGLLYLNAPSNHEFHRYPLDCWRFYPDAGVALCNGPFAAASRWSWWNPSLDCPRPSTGQISWRFSANPAERR